MKKLFIAIFFILIYSGIQAQLQVSKWVFGDGAMLDFQSGNPTPKPGFSIGCAVYAPRGDCAVPQEGTASIADASGQLLFFSDGERAWNRFGNIMPNGSGLLGGRSSTQAALIIPKPSSNSVFYLFTTGEFQAESKERHGLRYSIINMCADSSRGDVDVNAKNILLMDTTTEKISACQDFNGTGYWILGRKMFTSQFYAWHLTRSGISSPVITEIGYTPDGTYSHGRAQGQMKFDPNGTKIALTISNLEPAVVELFDFNKVSGKVTNAVEIKNDSTGIIYGIEFSPDSKKLFLTVGGGTVQYTGLYQYNITGIRTKIAGYESNTGYGLQAGPDGKIYVTNNHDGKFLNVINNPNDTGIKVNYVKNQVMLLGTTDYTLPSFIAGFKYQNSIFDCSMAPTPSTTNGERYVPPKVFPNPIINMKMTVACEDKWIARLFDTMGRLMNTYAGFGNSVVDLRVPSGVYIFEIYSKYVFTPLKIIVQH